MKPVQNVLLLLATLLLMLQQPLHMVSHEDFAQDCHVCTLLSGPQLDNASADTSPVFTPYLLPLLYSHESNEAAGIHFCESKSPRGPPVRIG